MSAQGRAWWILGLALAWEPAAFSARAQAPGRPDLDTVMRASASRPEHERLNAFFEAEWKHQMQLHPEAATYCGYPGRHDHWSDHSLAAAARDRAEAPVVLAALRGISRAALSPEDQLNFDLFERGLVEQMAGFRFPSELLVMNQMGGVQIDAAQAIAMMPSRTVADYEDILGRLRGLPLWIEQTIEVLNEGLARKVTAPQITLREVPAQIQSQIVEEARQSPLLRPFAEFPKSIAAPDQERLRAEAVKTYEQQIRPAWRKFSEYIEKKYLPAAVVETGLSNLPDGQEWYAHNARVQTTTSLTPREIHEIGLSEVKRIRGEMAKIMALAKFTGTLEEFFNFLRTDDRFFFSKPDDLLTGYREICKRIDPELARIFGTLPRLPYGVAVIPEYSEKTQTTAYYEPGASSVGRPGYFFANTYDLRSRPKWEMEALTLHEAVPGHHLQLALAQEMSGQPEFRRFGDYTAFVEGWGLYAESLGEELGLYKDPYMKFGQLTYEIWRSIRLVVDTGMHSLGWSRQKAIGYFEENAGKADHDITVEVDRYLVWPGQALAYKIGQLKIKDLRGRAERELGPKFDLRRFHDAVLLPGALPLDVLEKRVDRFIASEKSARP